MNATLQRFATVQPGHRVEVTVDEFQVGQTVQVYIVAQQPSLRDYPGQSLLEYIQKHRQPMKSYPTWEEYEKAIQTERDSWE
jgi:hypothetical protein